MKVVGAASSDSIGSMMVGISNFLIMPNMYPLTGTTRDYVVPDANAGRLFDNRKFIPKDEYYDRDIKITYPKDLLSL